MLGEKTPIFGNMCKDDTHYFVYSGSNTTDEPYAQTRCKCGICAWEQFKELPTYDEYYREMGFDFFVT